MAVTATVSDVARSIRGGRLNRRNGGVDRTIGLRDRRGYAHRAERSCRGSEPSEHRHRRLLIRPTHGRAR